MFRFLLLLLPLLLLSVCSQRDIPLGYSAEKSSAAPLVTLKKERVLFVDTATLPTIYTDADIEFSQYPEGENEFEIVRPTDEKVLGKNDSFVPWVPRTNLASVVLYKPKGGRTPSVNDDMLGMPAQRRTIYKYANVADLREDAAQFVSLGNAGGAIVLAFNKTIYPNARTRLQVVETTYGTEPLYESAYSAWNVYPERASVYISNSQNRNVETWYDDPAQWTLLGDAHIGSNHFEIPTALGPFRWVKIVDAGSESPDGFDLNFVGVYQEKPPVVLTNQQTGLRCNVTTASFESGDTDMLDGALSSVTPASEEIVDIFMFNSEERAQFAEWEPTAYNPIVGSFIAQVEGRLHAYELRKNCSVSGVKHQVWGSGTPMVDRSIIAQPRAGSPETAHVYGVANGYTYEWLGWVTYNRWEYNFSYRIIELDQVFMVPFKKIAQGRMWYDAPEEFKSCEQIPLNDLNLQVNASSRSIRAGQNVRISVDRYLGCSEVNDGNEIYNTENPITQYVWYDSRGKRIARGKVAYLRPRKTTTYKVVALDTRSGEQAQNSLKIVVNADSEYAVSR